MRRRPRPPKHRGRPAEHRGRRPWAGLTGPFTEPDAKGQNGSVAPLQGLGIVVVSVRGPRARALGYPLGAPSGLGGGRRDSRVESATALYSQVTAFGGGLAAAWDGRRVEFGAFSDHGWPS